MAEYEILDPAIRERVAVVQEARKIIGTSGVIFAANPAEPSPLIDLSEYLLRGHAWVHERQPDLIISNALAEIEVLRARREFMVEDGTSDGESNPQVGFMEIKPGHPLFDLFKHLFDQDTDEAEQADDAPTDPLVKDVDPDSVPDVDEVPTQKDPNRKFGIAQTVYVKQTGRRGKVTGVGEDVDQYEVAFDDGNGSTEFGVFKPDEIDLFPPTDPEPLDQRPATYDDDPEY